jgi:hypothetical protein
MYADLLHELVVASQDEHRDVAIQIVGADGVYQRAAQQRKPEIEEIRVCVAEIQAKCIQIHLLGLWMKAEDFVRLVKERFQVACAQCNELLTRPIRRVAICGGAGDFLLDDAVAQGADAFITGEMHYHVFFGREQQIQICVIGHYQSEQYTSEIFRDIIRRECPGVRTEIAETTTNPIVYL